MGDLTYSGVGHGSTYPIHMNVYVNDRDGGAFPDVDKHGADWRFSHSIYLPYAYCCSLGSTEQRTPFVARGAYK